MIKTTGYLVLLLAALSAIAANSTAQTAAKPNPLVSPTPADAASPSKNAEEDEKPFKPHWGNEIGFSHSNQQAGQNTNNLSYTGTYHLSETGNFVSGEVNVSTQKLEGTISKTGALMFTGGLGLGFFSPSLSIGAEGGESALHQLDGNLSMNFQITDSFSASLSSGGSLGNHQGDVSQYIPALQGLGLNILGQIDTASWNSSLGLTFVPWDWWTISLTTQNEYDITYKVQGIKNKNNQFSMNLTDNIVSLTLGLDFTITKGWILGFAPQIGQESSPAGTFYNSLAGSVVTFSTPTTQNFIGGTASISYSFE